MGLHIPVEVDGPTARLIVLAQAIQARGDLPDASAKRLVLLAKSVRLFIQAREPGEAVTALSEINGIGTSSAEEMPRLHDLLDRHITPIARTLGRQ